MFIIIIIWISRISLALTPSLAQARSRARSFTLRRINLTEAKIENLTENEMYGERAAYEHRRIGQNWPFKREKLNK